MRYPLPLTLLLLGLMGAAAAAPPAPFIAVYELSQGIFSFGTMERRLELSADGAYRFSSHMRTAGLVALLQADTVEETSSGHLLGTRFVPDSYEYRNSRGARHYALRFDHAAARVLRSDQPDGWSAPMPAALLDKLAYQVQMMLDLAAQPTSLTYNIADQNKLKEYLFDNRGPEDIATDAGHYSTVKFERDSAGSERRTTVWCAGALAWLPVKVEYREKDGSVTTALLRSVRTP